MLADACRDLTEATAAGASISLVTALTIFLLFVAVRPLCSTSPSLHVKCVLDRLLVWCCSAAHTDLRALHASGVCESLRLCT